MDCVMELEHLIKLCGQICLSLSVKVSLVNITFSNVYFKLSKCLLAML